MKTKHMKHNTLQALLFCYISLFTLLFTSCNEKMIFPKHEWYVYERLDSAYNSCYVPNYELVRILKEKDEYHLQCYSGYSVILNTDSILSPDGYMHYSILLSDQSKYEVTPAEFDGKTPSLYQWNLFDTEGKLTNSFYASPGTTNVPAAYYNMGRGITLYSLIEKDGNLFLEDEYNRQKIYLNVTTEFETLNHYYTQSEIYQLAPGYWKIYDTDTKAYITIKQVRSDSLNVYELSVSNNELSYLKEGLYLEYGKRYNESDDPYERNIRGITVYPAAYTHEYDEIYNYMLKKGYRHADNIDDCDAFIEYKSQFFDKIICDTVQEVEGKYNARFVLFKHHKPEDTEEDYPEEFFIDNGENEEIHIAKYSILVVGQSKTNPKIQKVLLEKPIVLPEEVELYKFIVRNPYGGPDNEGRINGGEMTFAFVDEAYSHQYNPELYATLVFWCHENTYGINWLLEYLDFNDEVIRPSGDEINMKESPIISPLNYYNWYANRDYR